MSDTVFPLGVHGIRPRKVSLSNRVDTFLDEQGLETPKDQEPYDQTHPKANNVNSIRCKSCDQIEYLSRVECRCGHYLRGQLEDEYLEWEHQLHADYDELSKLTEIRLKPLRYFQAFSIVFMLIPLLQVTFWPDSFSLKSLIWLAPAVMIGGVTIIAERHLKRPLFSCTQYFENYTFDTFIAERCSRSERFPEAGSVREDVV